jgi:L-methionine (R)-S-oxide reductase
MHAIKSVTHMPKTELYRELHTQLRGIFTGERNALANAANMSAILYEMLPELNWVGFYFVNGHELVLGPFQGKVACVRIAMGKGVCGAAAISRQIQLVPDVHAFPGHIACDAASNSEIVLPLIKTNRLLGVLDLDSPKHGRFDEDDAIGLSVAADLLLQSSDMDEYF